MLIDTHLHFYEYYSAELFLETLALNLGELSADACINAGVVLDRSGYHGFDLLVERAKSLRNAYSCDESGFIRYSSKNGSVDVYRGIQVACSEGFEVLGLFCRTLIDDGVSAASAIAGIKAAGGIPVVAWAPGKWLLGRRARVEKVLKEAGTNDVCIGDSALRPDVWGAPGVMIDFMGRGGKVLCGSDPLPYQGQERVVGTYASVIESADCDSALEAIRCMMSLSTVPGVAGRRSRLGEFMVRQIRVRLP